MTSNELRNALHLASLTALLLGLLPTRAVWAQDNGAIEACHNKVSTTEIVGCLDGLTAQWDKRLNAAYRVAIKGADPNAVEPLRASERAWLEYRKQRCYYLGAGPGTIGQVVASDCFLRMTKARAAELAEDAKGMRPG